MARFPELLLFLSLSTAVDLPALSPPEAKIARARAVLEACEQEFGTDHLEVRKALNDLGNALTEAQHFTEALAVFERALAIAQAHYGDHHLMTAQAHYQIGAQLARQGRNEDALAKYEEALAICESHEEPNPKALHDIVNNIALLYLKRAEYAKARPYFERTLHLARLRGGKDLARTLNNFGGLCREEGDEAIARGYFEEALEICIADRAEDTSLALSIRGNLAGSLRRFGHLTRAAEMQEMILETRERILGAMHPQVALTANNIGKTLSELGRYGDAQRYYERALSISEKHPRSFRYQ